MEKVLGEKNCFPPQPMVMDDKKMLALVEKYRGHLQRIHHLQKLRAQSITTESNFKLELPNKILVFDHLLSMTAKMKNFIEKGEQEKFFRWLGFMQGVLWSFGEFSINELRKDNKKLK